MNLNRVCFTDKLTAYNDDRYCLFLGVFFSISYLSLPFLFRYGYKAREHFVNWFVWFVKHRSFGESFMHSQLCIVSFIAFRPSLVYFYFFFSFPLLIFVLRDTRHWVETRNWSRA